MYIQNLTTIKQNLESYALTYEIQKHIMIALLNGNLKPLNESYKPTDTLVKFTYQSKHDTNAIEPPNSKPAKNLQVKIFFSNAYRDHQAKPSVL